MKKIGVLFVIILLILGAAGLYFFIQLGQADDKAIHDFTAAYTQFDQSMADFSSAVLNHSDPATSDSAEAKTSQALADLKTKASARVSSLTKNDGLLMQTFSQIASLAGQELDSVRSVKNAAPGSIPDPAAASRELNDLTNQRRAAYNIFLKLAGLAK